MYIRRQNIIFLKLLMMVMVAVPVIWTGAWLSHQPSTSCESYLNKPFLVIGIFLLLLSVARLGLYLISGEDGEAADSCLMFGLFVLFLVLLGYTIFALVVTATPTQGQSTDGGTDEHYYNYSKSLRNRVLDNNHWRHIKNCFVFRDKICSSVPHVIQNGAYQQSQSSHFSATQYGCCTPSKECNSTNTNRALLTTPMNSTLLQPECDEWNSDPYILCFNCQSCKDGFLHDIKRNWKKAATVNIAAILSLVMLWWCGDCGPDPEEDVHEY